ncbi:endonuclease V [Aliikangiella maris]|uniref:Endonuclease V n=2 Tax=Aliikangiella maris TaxID=3162458 RepID=A0ABV2BWR9_9GAMM
MWFNIVNRVAELKSIDSNKVVFGADSHKYEAAPLLTETLLNKYELSLKRELPEQLRSYYLEVGNGGFGPDYGICPLEEIRLYKPDCEWQGIDFYLETDEEYEDIASGMLGIMDRYYSHEGCIVTNGPDKGRFIEFSPYEGWIYFGATDLISLFTSWIDKELESFNILKRVIIQNNSIEDSLEELNSVYGLDHQNTLTRLASMLGFPYKYWPDAREALEFERVSDLKYDVKLTKNAVKMFNRRIGKFLSTESNLDLSKTEKQFTFMEFLAIDVDYRGSNAHVAGVSFSDWNDKAKTYESTVSGIEDYVSGEFYKRELPCILSLLKEHELSPDCIFVDGYVHLDEGKPGLGKYLYEALNKEVVVIGVAKNPRGNTMKENEVFRGDSKKPLYVTSEGIDLHRAKKIVEDMDGPFRIPKLIKLADSLCRQ